MQRTKLTFSFLNLSMTSDISRGAIFPGKYLYFVINDILTPTINDAGVQEFWKCVDKGKVVPVMQSPKHV